jgi:antitoxin ParD1/3/4
MPPKQYFSRQNRTILYILTMAQVNLSLPSALKDWVDLKVSEGRYSSVSDYMRDLVRRDQETAMAETELLRGLIADGLASGVVDEEPETVIENIIARRRAKIRKAAA